MPAGAVQVMQNGQAAEYGSPKELLANKNGIFTSMVNETGKATAKMLRSVASGATTLKDSRSAAAKSARERSAAHVPALNGLQARPAPRPGRRDAALRRGA